MITIYPQRDFWGAMVGSRSLLGILYTNMNTYCRQHVERTRIIADAIESDWVVVACSGETVRGFAFLKKDVDGGLYLPLICAALAHPMDRRSGIKTVGGGAMLRFIQDFCMKRGFTHIRLEALAPVITLYHKFGWRFVHGVRRREKREITAAVQALTGEIMAIRKSDILWDRVDAAVIEFFEKSNQENESTWWRLRDLLERNDFSAMTNELGDTLYTQVRRAEQGLEEASIDYGVGMDLRKALPSCDDAEDLGIDSTGELVKVDPQMAGYTMVWSTRRRI